MCKKILIPIIACLLCLTAIVPATAEYRAESSSVPENEAEASIPEAPVEEDALSDTIPQMVKVGDIWAYTASVPLRNAVPDEVLNLPTDELLEYFLNSKFLEEWTYAYYVSSSSDGTVQESDFISNKAYKELITRDNLVPLLEAYAGELLLRAEKDNAEYEDTVKRFSKLMSQDRVIELVKASSDANVNITRFMPRTISNKVKIFSSETVASDEDIVYYDAGTVKTASGADVIFSRPNRELTQAEVSYINSLYNYSGNTRLSSPTAYYNCHSFAWHSYSYSNQYWINDITEYLNDDVCSEPIAIQNARSNDIIVYLKPASNGYEILHSGVIEWWDENINNIKIRSKWGRAGVYKHSIGNVPVTYCFEDANGELRVMYTIFRYHNYTEKEYIRNYHFGKHHFYEYNNVCSICNDRVFCDTPVRKPCSGPPCMISIQSHENDDE